MAKRFHTDRGRVAIGGISMGGFGDHDSDYWNAHWSDYMRFYARALRRC